MEIESLLYLAGRPVTLKELKSAVKGKTTEIKNALEELISEYQQRETALSITKTSEDSYMLSLKDQFSNNKKLMQFMPTGYLSEGVLKTLSFIAINQPVTMYLVQKTRGSHVYKHVRELEDKKFIKTRMKDRTKVLETTDYFATYFCLSKDVTQMKSQLLQRIPTESN